MQQTKHVPYLVVPKEDSTVLFFRQSYRQFSCPWATGGQLRKHIINPHFLQHFLTPMPYQTHTKCPILNFQCDLHPRVHVSAFDPALSQIDGEPPVAVVVHLGGFVLGGGGEGDSDRLEEDRHALVVPLWHAGHFDAVWGAGYMEPTSVRQGWYWHPYTPYIYAMLLAVRLYQWHSRGGGLTPHGTAQSQPTLRGVSWEPRGERVT